MRLDEEMMCVCVEGEREGERESMLLGEETM